jgi:predicted enzyme related to lactoylglutathione lyase
MRFCTSCAAHRCVSNLRSPRALRFLDAGAVARGGHVVILDRFEVGMVSADAGVVDFLAAVFGLERQAPSETPVGTLHKLDSPGAVIKVMVPRDPPKSGEGEPFLAMKGIRYLSMFVSDLDGVLERCRTLGGAVLLEPFEFEPGSSIAIISDPDSNSIEVIGPS